MIKMFERGHVIHYSIRLQLYEHTKNIFGIKLAYNDVTIFYYEKYI